MSRRNRQHHKRHRSRDDAYRFVDEFRRQGDAPSARFPGAVAAAPPSSPSPAVLEAVFARMSRTMDKPSRRGSKRDNARRQKGDSGRRGKGGGAKQSKRQPAPPPTSPVDTSRVEENQADNGEPQPQLQYEDEHGSYRDDGHSVSSGATGDGAMGGNPMAMQISNDTYLQHLDDTWALIRHKASELVQATTERQKAQEAALIANAELERSRAREQEAADARDELAGRLRDRDERLAEMEAELSALGEEKSTAEAAVEAQTQRANATEEQLKEALSQANEAAGVAEQAKAAAREAISVRGRLVANIEELKRVIAAGQKHTTEMREAHAATVKKAGEEKEELNR